MRTRLFFLILSVFLSGLYDNAYSTVLREYPVYQLPGEPQLDGQLNDDVWRHIPEATGFFSQRQGEYALEKQTFFKAGWFKDALFLAIRCEDFSADKPKSLPKKDDSENIELVFYLKNSFLPLYLTVARQGTRSNSKGSGSAGEIWDWQAKTAVNGNAWTMEAGIPFALLETKPVEGERLAFNIIRRSAIGPERKTFWSCIFFAYDEAKWPVMEFYAGVLPEENYETIEEKINSYYRLGLRGQIRKMIGEIDSADRIKKAPQNEGAEINGLAAKAVNQAELILSRSNAGLQELGITAWKLNALLDKGKSLKLPIALKLRQARAKVFVNGAEIKLMNNTLTTEIKEGISVIALAAEALGENPGVSIRLPGHPETDGRWKVGKKEEVNWKEPEFQDDYWTAPSVSTDGYVWDSDSETTKTYFRQLILWNRDHTGPDRCIEPLIREWGISEGSVETLFLTLNSLLPYHIPEFEFILDVPAPFRLMDTRNCIGKAKDSVPEDVVVTNAVYNQQPYHRYQLYYKESVTEPDSKEYALLPVCLNDISSGGTNLSAGNNVRRFFYHRIGRGNFTELLQSIPVRILPPINGCPPKQVMIYQCAPVRHNGLISKEHLEAHMRQALKAGFNYWSIAPFGDEENVQKSMCEIVAASGNHVVLFSPAFWPLHGAKTGYVENDLIGWLETVPEARARFFKDSVSWEKDGVFCPSFATSEGKNEFRAGVKSAYERMLANMEKAEIIWLDWESFPWLAGRPCDGDRRGAHTGNGSWCFCERCKQAFRNFAHLPADITLSDDLIFKDYYQEWISFRCSLDGKVQGEIRQACRELGKSYMIYSWTGHRQFWEACKGKIDLAFPGCPGNAPADSLQQKNMDQTMSFFRDKLGMSRIIGQRFAFTIYSASDIRSHRFRLDSKDGYMNPRSWKAQLIRAAASFHGGLDLYNSLFYVGGDLYYIGEATRIISAYEPLFWDGERADELAVSDQIKYPNLLVLRKGAERLVLLFNEDRQPLSVKLRNKGLRAGQTAVIYGTALKAKKPAVMDMVVAPEDVAVVYIK